MSCEKQKYFIEKSESLGEAPNPNQNANPQERTAFSEADRKRFWAKVEIKGPDECWEWQACKNEKGYGLFQIFDLPKKAHRIAFEMAVGPIMNDLHVCHTCDNRPCCNPSHLLLGTHNDNMMDRELKGRNVVMLGEENGASALINWQVIEIKRLRSSGEMSQRAVAKKVAIGQGTVSRIALGQLWKHLFIDEVKE